MGSEKFMLSAADYIIFAAMLVVSAGIGIFFQLTSKKKTNEEYLLAGKDMSILPVAFSLMATFMSATTLMGIPAEMYLYGTNMAFMNIGFIIGPIITSYVFLPIYFANDVSTAYEYLEKRFGQMTRKITSAMFAIQTLFFTSATLYAPALALSAVTSLSMWMSVISVGLVCTFYCTLGGMKAVLWADVFQAVLMFVCLFAVIVQGCLLLGGIGNVFEIADEGGRLFFPKFSFDLGAHYTIVNIFAQGMIITMSSYGGGQCQVQRLMTLRNLKRSRIATFISIPMIVSFQLLCCLCGLVLYAYFRYCDPMTSFNKPIHSADQLIPYFISTTLDHLPGIPGLCICGIFSASLSTVSSAINSLASVATEDFIKPLFPKLNVTSFHTKIMSLVFGIICIALSFIIASLGHLVKMSVILYGNLAGPNLAVFLLAACTTTANEGGVILGIVLSIVLASCLSFIPENKTDPFLPLSNECTSVELAQLNSSFTSEFSNLQNYTNYIYSNATATPFNTKQQMKCEY
ncbi:Sodium-coupled monocarboxylate transporter 2 [Araneus ventricosus]|uniref:Sodium-coupled monocarboxylate transporter 2 n=1 Tax=Araneus ventricosus TaxID=182803 RepID=A0A4Y2NKT6_ARAVE|nr:Sodium-coupled monocarboxylate transporter 2 [Araneus ventricosus]